MGTLFMLFLWISINSVGSVSDLISTIVYIPTHASNISNIATGIKHDLRYGFHEVADCASFEKSFLCIQKCVDLNYDVAHANKDCKCTCYVKKEREKYKIVSAVTRTRWRSGAPKTSVPPWAGGVPVIDTDTITENYNVGSSEEDIELKGASTDSSNTEEILKDQITTSDASNFTAGTVRDENITNTNIYATHIESNTSLSTSMMEETTTITPVE